MDLVVDYDLDNEIWVNCRYKLGIVELTILPKTETLYAHIMPRLVTDICEVSQNNVYFLYKKVISVTSFYVID